MNEVNFFYLLPYLVSVMLSVAAGFLALRRRDVPGAGAYGLVALSEAVWAFGYMLELASGPLEAKIIWDDVQFIAGVGWFIGFLVFAVKYAGRRLTTPVWILLTAPALLFALFVITPPSHGWLRTSVELIPGSPFSALVYDFTPLVWMWAIYGYSTVIVGIFLLIRRFFRAPKLFRTQIGVVLVGTLIPIVGTFLTLVGVSFSFHRDTTPVTFAISNIIVTWALFRFRLFAVAPVARSVVVENLPGAVVVLDAMNRVVDLNHAAVETIGRDYADVIGLPVTEAFAPWSHLVPLYESIDELVTEISAMAPDGQREFEMSVTALRNYRHKLVGRVIVVRDITARKAAEAEVRRHRDNLEHMVADRTAELEAAVREARQLNVNLQKHDDVLRAVGAATEILLKTADWEEDIDDILALLGRAMDVDSVTLFRKHIGSDGILRASLTNEWSVGGIPRFLDDQRFKNIDVITVGYGRMLENWKKGKAFYGIVRDMLRRERALQRVWGISSFVHMPIMVNDALWGVASFNLMHEERTWSTTIIESLHTAANILGAVIERQLAQQSLSRYAERLRVLREIDGTILAAESPEAIAKAALERIQELIPCQLAAVVLTDLSSEKEVTLAIQPASGYDVMEHASTTQTSYCIPPDKVMTVKTGNVNIVTDLSAKDSLAPMESALLSAGMRTYVNIPLMLQDELVGLLNLGLKDASDLTPENLETAQAIAYHLAMAIQQARLHEQIRRHAAELELRVAERTKALEEANEELRSLSMVKDQFVSNVSHELRTPITSLRLYHELLLKRPERQDDYIKALQRETQRLNILVEDILTLSRMDQDQSTLVYDTLDINDLAREYVKDREILVQDKGLSLQFTSRVDPIMAVVDRNMLGQAISVLLTNALNYTPSGGQITMQTHERVYEGKKWAGISVRDTGPGISDDEQEHIFTRFYRGKVGRESGIPGTGLGLAIAYEIVERHMGYIEVKNKEREGGGTEFTIWLPLPDSAEKSDDVIN